MGQKLNLHINMGKLFCLLQEKLEPFVFGYELIVAVFRSFLSGLCLWRIWNNIIKRYLDFIMWAWLWGLSPQRPAFLCFCESRGLMKAGNKRQIFCMCKWPVTSSCYFSRAGLTPWMRLQRNVNGCLHHAVSPARSESAGRGFLSVRSEYECDRD